MNSTINVSGTARVNGSIYGGGNNGATIGTSNEDGTTNINIIGGTITSDVNGGGKGTIINNESVESIVYGDTFINISSNAIDIEEEDPEEDEDEDENTIQVVTGNISIEGYIYGAGASIYGNNRREVLELNNTSLTYNYTTTTVYGDTNITIDGSDLSITIGESIFGAGNAGRYNGEANITIENYGTISTVKEIQSIQRADNLYIGNSWIKLNGKPDNNNSNTSEYYSLNRIGNLTVYNNAVLYFPNNINLVEEYNSLISASGNNTSVSTNGNEVISIEDNIINRIYMLQTNRIVFATVETDLVDVENSSANYWGEINGMTYVGLYAEGTNRILYGQYNPNTSAINTSEVEFIECGVIEGKHKTSHNINVDGFFTWNNEDAKYNIVDVTPENENYYDWIIGDEEVYWEISLTASAYERRSTKILDLSGLISEGQTYRIQQVNLNELRAGYNLVNQGQLETAIVSNNSASTNANNTFGLTFETTTHGWSKNSKTNVLTASSPYYSGNNTYYADNSGETASMLFTFYSATNITKRQFLGKILIKLLITNTDSSTEEKVIGVRLYTEIDNYNDNESIVYMPLRINANETSGYYTSDSTIGISYKLYYEEEYDATNITALYSSGDYRAIATKYALPINTKMTLCDHVTGIDYYYKVTSTATISSNGYYIYRLSNFKQIGSTTDSALYEDDNSNYYSTDNIYSEGTTQKIYAYERYNVYYDFSEAEISTNINAQEMYLILLNSSSSIKYDKGQQLTSSLIHNSNAEFTFELDDDSILETTYLISNKSTSNTEWNLNLVASIIEQKSGNNTIIDTKYRSQSAGMIVEVIDTNGNRIPSSDIQNFTVRMNGTTYTPNSDNSAIRVLLGSALAQRENSIKITLRQKDVEDGTTGYVRISYFASDDGKYLSNDVRYVEDENLINIDIPIEFEKTSTGLEVVCEDNATRIISSSTGKNLASTEDEPLYGIDWTINVALDPNSNEKVIAKLYKRNSTYNATNNVYIEPTYTEVDLEDYLTGTWDAFDTNEYTILSVSDTGTNNLSREIEFEHGIETGIATGEYKLVFYLYKETSTNNYTVLQQAEKTFVIIE